MNTLLFLAAASSGQSGSEGSPLGFFLPIILIFAIMYFLIFRPQAKRQKQHRQMLDSLEKGDRVVTAGGIYGTVIAIKEKEKTVMVKIADNTKIELARSSVAHKLADEKQQSNS